MFVIVCEREKKTDCDCVCAGTANTTTNPALPYTMVLPVRPVGVPHVLLTPAGFRLHPVLWTAGLQASFQGPIFLLCVCTGPGTVGVWSMTRALGITTLQIIPHQEFSTTTFLDSEPCQNQARGMRTLGHCHLIAQSALYSVL